MSTASIEKNSFTVLGIMSGTSLDGVDIALCKFNRDSEHAWDYSIKTASTIDYDNSWKERLIAAETMSGLDLILLHKEYGAFLGNLALQFLSKSELKPDFIASHGHTIFHQPEKQLTFQLGDGAFIAATAGITTISDFRNLDVALGGQGAPLVPIGDEILFNAYDQCLNLGGFANVSYNIDNRRIAFDICPVNIVLNYLTKQNFNTDFDKDGSIGRSGKVDDTLLNQLNNLEFYKETPPKSLGKEWVLSHILPLLASDTIPANDKMSTMYESIAIQISEVINSHPGQTVLITGGGAYNGYLLELIKSKTSKSLVVPEKSIIEFKEALIFGFLGVLRYLNLPNCLASVTGSRADNSGGIIHWVSE